MHRARGVTIERGSPRPALGSAAWDRAAGRCWDDRPAGLTGARPPTLAVAATAEPADYRRPGTSSESQGVRAGAASAPSRPGESGSLPWRRSATSKTPLPRPIRILSSRPLAQPDAGSCSQCRSPCAALNCDRSIASGPLLSVIGATVAPRASQRGQALVRRTGPAVSSSSPQRRQVSMAVTVPFAWRPLRLGQAASASDGGSISRISTQCVPPGAWTSTTSPWRRPRIACPTGDWIEIRRRLGSASAVPTSW